VINFAKKLLGRKMKTSDIGAKLYDLEHREQITIAVKTIMMCPTIDNDIRNIMILRVWGADSQKHKPLTLEEVAYLRNRCSHYPTDEEIREVTRLEEQGKWHCEQFQVSMGAQEIIDKFNENATKNKGQMFGKMTYEKGKFSV